MKILIAIKYAANLDDYFKTGDELHSTKITKFIFSK